MKLNKSILCLASCILFSFGFIGSSFASPGCHDSGTGGYCDGTITQLVVGSDRVYIATDGAENALKKCKATSGIYFELLNAQKGFEEKYSAAMMAYALKRKALIRVYPTTPNNGKTKCVLAYIVLK